jgi:hypothetical protein
VRSVRRQSPSYPGFAEQSDEDSIPARGAMIYPCLLEGLAIERPNQAWTSSRTCQWRAGLCTWWRS